MARRRAPHETWHRSRILNWPEIGPSGCWIRRSGFGGSPECFGPLSAPELTRQLPGRCLLTWSFASIFATPPLTSLYASASHLTRAHASVHKYHLEKLGIREKAGQKEFADNRMENRQRARVRTEAQGGLLQGGLL